MSMMLNFFDAAWASARVTAAAGRRAAALAELAPLLNSPNAPTRLTVLAHRLAARLESDAGRYPRARNHLRAAIRLDRYDAELHYELGVAFESDPSGCDLRAARRFRRAVQLNSRHAKYAAAFGRALVRLNRARAGVTHLRGAAVFAPADSKVLKVVVDGLCDAGQAELARVIVVKARFRAPSDKVILALWYEVRYAIAQQAGRRPDRAAPTTSGPRTLPFMRLVTDSPLSAARGVVRRDAGSRPVPHIMRLRSHRAEQG